MATTRLRPAVGPNVSPIPDGTIHNIVLPAHDRQRLDDIVARKETTRSALLTDVLDRARSW
jgi:hypothetical protein